MEKNPAFTELKLLPGTKVELRSEKHVNLNGNCFYIGYKSNKAIMISTPVKNGITAACTPGSEVTLRFFIQQLNCACAFRTKVIHVSATPFPHWYLAPPKEIEVSEMRKSARAHTNLACSIITEELKKPIAVFIEDMSADGAKIHSKKNFGQEGDKITLNTHIEVINLNDMVQINGIIRSVVSNGIDFIYGVEFIGLDDYAKLMIYAFVMTELSQ